MTEIMSRSETNLPPVPSSIGHRSLSSWAGIRVHHTGGSFSSWRAIHDWQTEGRPDEEELAYIGYSFGISDGNVWTLRGWDHQPAHDFINTHLGVVFGGNFNSRLPSAADLDALVWFIREAKRLGVRTNTSTHREVGQTTCPGDALHRWVKQELPGRLAQEEDDMQLNDRIDLTHNGKRLWAGQLMDRDSISVEEALMWGLGVGPHIELLPVLGKLAGQVAGLTELVRDLAAAPPVPVTPEQLAALTAAVEQAATAGAANVVDVVERISLTVDPEERPEAPE